VRYSGGGEGVKHSYTKYKKKRERGGKKSKNKTQWGSAGHGVIGGGGGPQGRAGSGSEWQSADNNDGL